MIQKNKKGFTLTEMLAVVAIMAIFAGFAMTNFLGVFDTNLKKTMQIQENNVADAAKLYMQDYCLSPVDSSLTCPLNNSTNKQIDANGFVYYVGTLCLSHVIEAGYIDSVHTNRDTECNGYVKITADSNGIMNYKSYLYCGENGNAYKTDGYEGRCE